MFGRCALLILSSACGTGPGAASLDAGTGDGSGATECSADDPRSEAPEPFVGPEGLRERIVGWIGGATSTLDAATYLVDDEAILAALEAAQGRGVRVRVLADGTRGDNGAVLERLRAAGVDARAASEMFEHYHPKLLVVDGAAAVVMSANLNGYSMETERNHGVVLRDPRDVAHALSLFEVDFDDAPADLTCTRLVISPNNSRERIETLVGSAVEELRFEQLSFTDDAVRRLTLDRAAAGVRVRVILADPAWIESNTESARVLRDGGVEVRFLRTLDNHAKLIASDGAVFVGSENLSWTSLERNRELGIVSDDPSTVGPLVDSFEADWVTAVP